MKLLLFIFVFIISFACQAGPGTFPQGDHVKLLKDKLEFKNTLTQVISNDSDDPTSVAKSAAISSLYLREGTAGVYVKTDAGSSTNWEAILTETLADLLYYPQGDFINSSAGAGDAGKPIVLDADGNIDATMLNDGDIDHGGLAGLADDDHAGYLWGLGRSGGQTLNGGTDAGDDLTLSSTTNATKGTIFFGANSAYDQVNDRLGIGTTTPGSLLDVVSTTLSSLPWPAMTETQRDAIGAPATGSSVYNTTDNSLNTYNSSTWNKLLDDKYDDNYIANFHAEKDTTGWATYADAAGAVPVDGTGGSPTVTWTRSTSTPLRDTANFLFTKDAADRQGEGASYAFTIDNTDQAKALNITFDVSTSANYVDEDMIVYIYDVTNAALIEPVPRGILAGTNGKFNAQFQTAPDSTSYRLIFHVSTDSSDDYTVKFDNIKIGPSKVSFGVPATDWEAFTPTGSFTSNVTYSGYKRRVGDSIEVTVRMLFSGAPNSTTATINLPNVLDDSKLYITTSNLTPIGTIELLDSGTAAWKGTVRANSTTVAGLQYNNGTGGLSTITQAAPFTIGNLDEIRMNFKYPVVGWSSNVQMSDDSDTRVVAARYSTNAGDTITNSANEVICFEDKIYDTHNAVTFTNFATQDWVFTAPISGKYAINSLITLQATSAFSGTELFIMYIEKNTIGTTFVYTYPNSNSTRKIAQSNAVFDLVKGDEIRVVINQASGSDKLVDTESRANYIDIFMLQGPSSIMANELVGIKYGTDAGQSIDNASWEIVNFDDTDNRGFDTHGIVTTGASWKATIPTAGKYNINAFVSYSSTANWDTGEFAQMQVYVNGTATARLDFRQAQSSSTTLISLSGSTTLDLYKGDYVDVRVYQNTGSALTLQSFSDINNITIVRQGF